MIGLRELLTARTRVLEAEQRRERIFAIPRILGSARFESRN